MADRAAADQAVMRVRLQEMVSQTPAEVGVAVLGRQAASVVLAVQV